MYSDLSFYQTPYDEGWHTAVVLRVRNVGPASIVLKKVTLESVTNVELGRTGVIGPQSPTLSTQILPGYPPRSPAPDFPVSELAPKPIAGYEVPPAVAGSEAPPFSAPSALVESDEENDASIVVPMRLIDHTATGSIVGVKVTYLTASGEAAELSVPDLEFGLCIPAEFEEGNCGDNRHD